jgi:hypothetical protein
MKTHRDTLIETATADSELPPGFARLLIKATPWLDGTQEVSEELALDLLAEEAGAFNLSQSKISEFIDRYNTLVLSTANPHSLLQTEAYVAMGQALAPCGRADAFGDGDYWLVSDSFATRTPVVLLYNEFRVPNAVLSKLQELLNQYSTVFSELRINAEHGAEVTTLRPQ